MTGLLEVSCGSLLLPVYHVGSQVCMLGGSTSFTEPCPGPGPGPSFSFQTLSQAHLELHKIACLKPLEGLTRPPQCWELQSCIFKNPFTLLLPTTKQGSGQRCLQLL